MITRLPFKQTIILAGLVLLVTTGISSLLSHRFIYGSGHMNRPILEFVGISFVGFASYFLVIEKLRSQSREDLKESRVLFWIILISILARLLYVPSQFIQETDPYRYVWDGQTVLAGENPYRHSPKEVLESGGTPISQNADGQKVAARINHPGIKTIYPPMAQLIFLLSQLGGAWGFGGFKVLLFLSEMGTLALLAALLRLTAKPLEWIILYGWSPLVLKEFSNSLHVDAFAVLFLSAALYTHFKNRTIWTFALLALATLVKLFAIFLVIPYAVYSWQKSRKALTVGLAVYFGLVLLFYAPFMNAGSALFEGLGRFALDWRVNEGLFGVIRWVSRRLISFDLPLANQVARTFAMGGILILTLGASLWAKQKATALALSQAWLAVLSALFFLSPAANPWYFTWFLPLLLITPVRSFVLFSGLVFIYYLDLYFAYRGSAHSFDWFRVVEYGLFFSILGWELWPKIKQSQLYCRFQTSAV